MRKIGYQIGVGCADISKKEKEYVKDVLEHERLSYGPYTKKFEEEFARAHGCRYAIFLNSGTSALRIAVAALKEIEGWKDGDEVLCPAVTFVASSNVIIMNGLKPVFVDVDPRTYNIDPRKIEEEITKKTRAIMAVNLFGQPADMDPILKIAKKHKLKIIEDSCETMFVKYKGRPAGSFGDISCFSTYVAHLLVTGVGGFSCTSNPKYAEVMKSLANHGRDGIYLHIDDDKNLNKQGLFQVVSRRFHFIRLGYSFRATEMEAALGIGQMERKDQILGARKKNAAYLLKKLKPLAQYLQLPWHPGRVEHSFMMFPIVVKRGVGIKKQDLVMYLEEHNVETRDMLPLLSQPVYKKLFGDIENQYPVAKWVNGNGFYIGCHQKLTKKEMDYMVAVFEDFFKKRV
ncbi:MAG: DegT/DnrJ/EryC1/StrS family aminotransferase [Candidatus Harrisonbacteria bacterium]|nr:DegT/DnrJ/EryC1/StrS family aminotransferase [Candidatus Harrisonbacteria bacterium]